MRDQNGLPGRGSGATGKGADRMGELRSANDLRHRELSPTIWKSLVDIGG
jgi:hypothetical protein